MERTLVLVKPDGVLRRLIGETIKRIEQKNLKIVAMKMIQITEDLAEEHYREHKGKPFFKDLIDYITLAPVVAMVVEGERAIDVMRNIAGKTNPDEALPGSIRGDFGYNTERFMCNVVHASDSDASAKREIDLFFREEEILDYKITVI
ncbi:MAG: nucleoside-diphosphate kinase [Methanomicrobia archaeon]|nr:nucleoside-diphosphate kinase [Methanomicrobia archaeon]HDM23296.1 nucleoside-diphosphate kinase [Methanomicrobia archaeon]